MSVAAPRMLIAGQKILAANGSYSVAYTHMRFKYRVRIFSTPLPTRIV